MRKEIRNIVYKAISEMLDNPGECDIYPTTKCYDTIENQICSLIIERLEKIEFDPYYESTTAQRKIKAQIDQLIESLKNELK